MLGRHNSVYLQSINMYIIIIIIIIIVASIELQINNYLHFCGDERKR